LSWSCCGRVRRGADAGIAVLKTQQRCVKDKEYTPPTSNQVHHRDCRRLCSVCVILRLLFINSYLCFGNYSAHQCNITWLEQVMPYLHHIYAFESKNPLFCKFWKTCDGSYFFDTAFNFARLVAPYPARGLWSLDASFMNMNGIYNPRACPSCCHFLLVAMETALTASSSPAFAESTRVVHPARISCYYLEAGSMVLASKAYIGSSLSEAQGGFPPLRYLDRRGWLELAGG